MELWDVLDKNRKKTGRLVERGNPNSLLGPGEYHLVVFAIIRNCEGNFLISKRTPNKTFPNMWEITGGSAITGDDSMKAVLREIKEEVGLTVDPSRGKIIGSVRVDDNRSYFADVWLFDHDVNLSEIVCQPEEVSEAKIATKDEILKMTEEGSFIMNPFVLKHFINL
ncbi:MAG TPA: NUDIX domain-containing protein [Thermotogota bacterium]|nr:NUDIX domain-containing protein [Thermotogota bacterium]HPJ89391.1 NUDIX domain-containing protein [Thermotogota bacterium]HPR96585.1 NUDIX domain-containing protein [Thermotogota bacterium]